MTTLFDTEVSVGKTIRSNTVSTQKLTRERFDQYIVLDDGAVKDGLYFTPAKMRGTVRRTQHIDCVTLLAFDIDKMKAADMAELIKTVQSSGLECIQYTTASHTVEEPRYRFIFNPSRNLTVDEYKCVMPQLAEYLGITSFDQASLTVTQPMFYPMVYASQLGSEQFVYHTGDKVDVEPMVLAMISADNEETYVSSSQSRMPMAIPGAMPESLWLSCVLEAYKAEDISEDDYNKWVEVGMAIYHQTNGKGFDVWLDWTRKNTKVHGQLTKNIQEAEAAMVRKWPTFNDETKKLRPATLRKILNQKNKQGRTILSEAYKNLLSVVTESVHLKRIASDIQDDPYVKPGDYKSMGTEYQAAMLKVNGESLSLGDAMMTLRKEHVDTGRREYFYNHYMFSEAESQYYDMYSKEPVSIISMNYQYGSQMPTTHTGERKIVHKVLTTESNGYVKPRMMHGRAYDIEAGPFVQEGSRYYLNEFKPESWPQVNKLWDRDDAIDKQVRTKIHKHLGLLCNGDTKLMMMIIQHLGHLRQNPMKRMHFAYAISSTFGGAGKSTLRKLYSTVLGEEQVNLLSASNIAEDFNGYAAAPKLMSFIEEFEFDSRREQNKAIKKMKDLITSDTVSVRRMRRDATVARTYTAYAIFSNDEYVLGHESTGRRWVPIVVDAVNKEQASAVLGMDHKQFYTEYHELMDKFPERFVAYFDAVSLEGFETEAPPETPRKQMFIENVPQARCLRIIQEIIEDNTSCDLTADYACGNSVFKLVRTYLDFNTNADVDELIGFNNRQLRGICDKALRAAGYQLAGTSSERLRLPFDEVERTRMNDVWVKDRKRYGGMSGIKRLRRRIVEDRKTRLNAMEGKLVSERPPLEKGLEMALAAKPYIPTDEELNDL